MKVSTTQPFRLVYSIFQHEYLGYLLESFVVQINSKGELSYQYQNISSNNAREFDKGIDEEDYEAIRLIEKIQQESIIKKFYNKKVKNPADFFLKVYDKEKGDKVLQNAIEQHIESHKKEILSLILNKKPLFVMGKDGLPTWKVLQYEETPLRMFFHFRREEQGTIYFPVIKQDKENLKFRYQGAFMLCNEPALLVLKESIYHFDREIEGKKLKPFLNKNQIEISRNIEERYYKKFIKPLLVSGRVYAEGFEIHTLKEQAEALLHFEPIAPQSRDLFGNDNTPSEVQQIMFRLMFRYGQYSFPPLEKDEASISVKLEQQEGEYHFYRIKRVRAFEQAVQDFLKNETGLRLQHGKLQMSKPSAFDWIAQHQAELAARNIMLQQKNNPEGKQYFVGENSIHFEIRETQDWFDVKAKIRFGEYEIPFLVLRQAILKGKTEISLPNGTFAVIPETWLKEYADLFRFSQSDEAGNNHLQKHHVALLQDLQAGTSANISLSDKLKNLDNFERINDYELPQGFKGDLRSYQKAGYNWLRFLNDYHFGGCLADDMGLGKTVQTLALLQAQQNKDAPKTSLLIMPTSLVYNWQLEAKRFTPKLKVLTYMGSNRLKSTEHFAYYDLVLTSYGTTRVDVDILKDYYFNYVILDESQAIKNPSSNIHQAVIELQSRNRLILTGTPLENSVLDLWAQMSFVNPGLLGNQKFFKKHYLKPIEKEGNQERLQRLSTLVKPFILRRLKSQVALDLPDKIENVQYCLMSPEQEAYYKEVRNQYREQILQYFEQKAHQKPSQAILTGLTKLRQIANHPKLVKPDFEGESGKQEEIAYKLDSIISEGHKVLIFSTFVKNLELFRTYIEQKNYGYSYLTGNTRDRQKEVERFQQDPNTKIFLISLRAGGVGLNLTAAEYVFLLDPWWNPASEAQAIDRAYRIGQKNTVFTYKFITRDTVEEKILALQKSKRLLADNLVQGEESFAKNLSQEDLLNLI